MNRLDQLLLASLDGAELTAADDAELAELLAEPAEAHRAILLLEIEAILRAAEPLESVADSTVERLREARNQEALKMADDVLNRITSAPVMRWSPASRRSQKKYFFAGGLAAVAAAVFGAFLVLKKPEPTESTAALQMLKLAGEYDSVVIHRGEIQMAAMAGANLRSGDRIHVTGKGSATFGADGGKTRVELESASDLRIAGTESAPRFELRAGAVGMSVAPRLASGRPLEIVTRTAVATVRGTRFRLAETPAGAWLTVTEGAVDFARRERESERLWVAAGYFAVIPAAGEPRQFPLPAGGVARIPLPLDFSRPETFGDSEWSFDPPQFQQKRLSGLPRYADQKGFTGSALASCMVGIPAVSGVQVEARVRIDRSHPPESPEAQSGFGLGVRVQASGEQFRFRSIEDPGLHILSIGLAEKARSQEIAEPRVIDFTHLPAKEWRLKFIATRRSPTVTVLRGKFWAADEPEPTAWQLDTTGPGASDFTQIGVESTRLAVTWLELSASQIE